MKPARNVPLYHSYSAPRAPILSPNERAALQHKYSAADKEDTAMYQYHGVDKVSKSEPLVRYE